MSASTSIELWPVASSCLTKFACWPPSVVGVGEPVLLDSDEVGCSEGVFPPPLAVEDDEDELQAAPTSASVARTTTSLMIRFRMAVPPRCVSRDYGRARRPDCPPLAVAQAS